MTGKYCSYINPKDEFDCYCGSANCRKHVTGSDWMISALWERYNGYFSPYLARRIEAHKLDQ
jgi:hypothetical protein